METVDNSNFLKELNPKQVKIFEEFSFKLINEQSCALEKIEDKGNTYLNQNEIIRILIAREFDQKKSLEMWKKWVQWRE